MTTYYAINSTSYIQVKLKKYNGDVLTPTNPHLYALAPDGTETDLTIYDNTTPGTLIYAWTPASLGEWKMTFKADNVHSFDSKPGEFVVRGSFHP